MVEKKKPAAVRHPELRHSLQSWKQRGGTTLQIKKALGVTIEQARRYTLGEAMPRPSKMKTLAALIGLPPGDIQYGKRLDPRRSAAMAPIQTASITGDERGLLKTYRQLPDYAQQALRMRAVELLEEFGESGADNPFSKQGAQ